MIVRPSPLQSAKRLPSNSVNRYTTTARPAVPKFGTDPGTAFSFYMMLAGFGALGGLVGGLAILARIYDPDPPETRKLKKALRKAALKKAMQDPEFWRKHPLENVYDPINPFNKGPWR